jgi:nucleotide-binding universal stress UspA family protein
VLTVDERAERAQHVQELIKPNLRAHRTATRYLVERGVPAEVIPRVAGRERAGWIAMGAFNRNPIYELFFGSTTLSVLERSNVPVLLMS